MAHPSISIGELYNVKGRLLRPVHQAWSATFFDDSIICLKDNPWNQIVALFFQYLEPIHQSLMLWEAKRLGIEDGGRFPVLSVNYWIGQLFVLTNRFGMRVSRDELGSNY